MIEYTHCCYCRRKYSDTIVKTVEHFIPSSKGGLNGENLLQCCSECNQWKADRMPDFWINRVEYYLDRRTLYGTYKLNDYKQIIGSVRFFMKKLKGKKISQYKY